MLSIHLQASHIWSNSCILHSSFLLGAVVLFFHALPFPSSSFPPPLSHPHIISSFSVDPIHVFSPHAGPQTDSKQSCFPLKMFVPQAVIPGMRADSGVIVHSEHTKARAPLPHTLTHWKTHNWKQCFTLFHYFSLFFPPLQFPFLVTDSTVQHIFCASGSERWLPRS